VSDPRSTTETSREAEVSTDERTDVDRSPELLLAFYGDDLTGSTAVLEALAKNGVRTALFFDPPTPDELTGRFADLAAVGVAGRSRSMTPSQMNERLAPAFEALRALDPECCHYKVCTTFDSSPEIGSIGHAIDLGQDSFDSPFVPLLIGNPPLEPLGRYVVFGNLFATQDGEVYRLDRHPTMSNHPVTPMDESDLRRHLRRQTDRDIGLVDVLDMWGDPAAALERERSDAEVVLFDTLRRAHLEVAGRLLWSEAQATDGSLFAVGSSAVEYALTGRWQENGRVPDRDRRGQVDAVDRLLVMSGSAAPVTAEQIDRAVGAGFADVRLESGALVDPDGAADARERAVSAAATALENTGASCCTALAAPKIRSSPRRGPGRRTSVSMRANDWASSRATLSERCSTPCRFPGSASQAATRAERSATNSGSTRSNGSHRSSRATRSVVPRSPRPTSTVWR
jgi:uncharacterized protein YgbK (DUF1537 family)